MISLPSIFVDRPAWGAAIGNPARVTGSANGFRRRPLRVAILDGSGTTLIDQWTMATCGIRLPRHVRRHAPLRRRQGSMGTLRSYSTPPRMAPARVIRDYPVWLTPGADRPSRRPTMRQDIEVRETPRPDTVRRPTHRRAVDIHPMRLRSPLLSLAHAMNHACSQKLLPLIFLKIIDEFGVSVAAVAILAAVGSFASGLVQLTYAGLTRIVSRRVLLGVGGILFGGGIAIQTLATNFATFAIPNILWRIGGSPQHPVGNGLLAEQFPTERRGFAISAHIAGGNVGTVLVALIGAPLIVAIGWRGASLAFGLPAIVIAIAILLFVRERGTDRAAALAGGSVRSAFGRILRDSDLRWLYLTSALGGGGRGLGRRQPVRADLPDQGQNL